MDSLWLLYDARGWYRETIGLTNDLLDVLSSAPSTPDRAGEEITLRTALARALLATKGYSREVEEAYATALQPFEGRELPQLFPVLRSLASYYIFQSEFDKAARIGREILRLAERQQDTGMLVEGHLVVGMSIITLEGIPAALEQLDEAIALFRAEPFGVRPFRLGNNAGGHVLHQRRVLPLDAGLPRQGGGAGRRGHGHGQPVAASVQPCLRGVPLRPPAPVAAAA